MRDLSAQTPAQGPPPPVDRLGVPRGPPLLSPASFLLPRVVWILSLVSSLGEPHTNARSRGPANAGRFAAAATAAAAATTTAISTTAAAAATIAAAEGEGVAPLRRLNP